MTKYDMIYRLEEELGNLRKEKDNIRLSFEFEIKNNYGTVGGLLPDKDNMLLNLEETINYLERVINEFKNDKEELPSIGIEDDYLEELAGVAVLNKKKRSELMETVDFYLSYPSLADYDFDTPVSDDDTVRYEKYRALVDMLDECEINYTDDFIAWFVKNRYEVFYCKAYAKYRVKNIIDQIKKESMESSMMTSYEEYKKKRLEFI